MTSLIPLHQLFSQHPEIHIFAYL